jgi:hypothetical protein
MRGVRVLLPASLAGVLLMPAVGALWADDPAKAPSPSKPPWQRLLRGVRAIKLIDRLSIAVIDRNWVS